MESREVKESKFFQDESLPNCSCKREQVKILLIGRTQNGKSSLVKSILSYGGHHDLSKMVKKGNSNVSQTQVVSAYGRKIELKEHFLQNKQGKNITFTPSGKDIVFSSSQVKQLETTGVKHHALPSERHIHLKILDTPGLDDSNNYKAAAATFKHKSITELSTLKVVDEQHKLEMMQRLLGEWTIHGVCFVIKWNESFSNSIQDDIKAYLEIFEESKLRTVKYFILHTAVLPSSRTREIQSLRKSEFQKKFHFPATHFFLDSEPDSELPLEVYLSQLQINELLISLASNKACPVPDLQYTKSGPQQSLDADLRNLMGQDVIAKVVGAELEDRMKEKEKVDIQIKSITQQLARSEKRKLNKEEDIRKLDTDDPVDILEHPVTLDETWRLWRSSVVVFDIPTNTVIREVEKDPNDEHWSEESGIGTCQFHAKYTGPSRTSIKVTVTLKGHKREHFQVELEVHCSELKTHVDTIRSLTTESNTLKQKKEVLDREVKNLGSIKKGLGENVKLITSRTLSLKNAWKDCVYLTICNAIGTSLAYKLIQEIPKKYLPPNNTPQINSLAELTKQRSRWDKMLGTVQTVLNAFASDLKRKKPIANDLRAFQKQVQDARKWTNSKLSTKPKLQVGILAQAYRRHVREETRENLEALEQDLLSRGEGLDERLENLREMEDQHLEDLVNDIGNAIKDAAKLIKSNKAECKEWGTYRQICDTTIAAIEETARLCRSDTLPPGPFYIIYKVLISNSTPVVDPYSTLFDEILAAYHIRDSGKIMVLQREMDMADEDEQNRIF